MEFGKNNMFANARGGGSALILAVVLTSLLAMIGTLFFMSARIQKRSTSGLADQQDLDQAVESIIAQISNQLVLDVPGMPESAEYCDYPDANDLWLANLEPYYDGTDYRWGQISDIFRREVSPGVFRGMLEELGADSSGPWLDDFVGFVDHRNLNVRVIFANDTVTGVRNSVGAELSYGGPADADGDGVADSRWVMIPGMTSSKGRPIYAAIRIIDNGGMLNANTAFMFDPCAPRILRGGNNPNTPDIINPLWPDGSSMLEINLMGLSWRPDDPNSPYDPCDVYKLIEARISEWDTLTPVYPNWMDWVDIYGVWSISGPALGSRSGFTFFDISDELEFRNRFVLNHTDIDTRLERWGGEFRQGMFQQPINNGDLLSEWYITTSAAEGLTPDYSYRHLTTTFNMDRVIDPYGVKMISLNSIWAYDPNVIRDRIHDALPFGFDPDSLLSAQMTANLIDFIDADSEVSVVEDDLSRSYYGFERPCVYISELAYNHAVVNDVNYVSYAIELHKPYSEDEDPDPNGWQVVVVRDGNDITIPVTWTGNSKFHVIRWHDPNANLPWNFNDPCGPNPTDGATGVKPNIVLDWIWGNEAVGADSNDVYLGTDRDAVLYATRSDNSNADYYLVQGGNNFIDPHDPLDDSNSSLSAGEYYWRVDSVASDGTIIKRGNVLKFTVGGSIPVVQDVNDPIAWSFTNPVFLAGNEVQLQRRALNGDWILVDYETVPGSLLSSLDPNSHKRDITLHKCIRRLWPDDGRLYPPSLGNNGNPYIYQEAISVLIQAHPGDAPLTNIGEIGMVLWRSAYPEGMPALRINRTHTETDVRIDISDARYQGLFNILTVFDPATVLAPPTNDPNEMRIPGRININTAPWYVIEQLPWISQSPMLARSIVAYREKNVFGTIDYTSRPGWPGFRNIGELNNVVNPVSMASMDSFALDANDLNALPDLSPGDGAVDDFEERNVIFARISNLITVRSDVFTAYILVRVGEDGPQKRMIAILDRSEVEDIGDRVRVRALHPVHDPR